jgi:choline dehydrogenase-like flavoprotein
MHSSQHLVIGSGSGGPVAARRLSDAGLTVTLHEAGWVDCSPDIADGGHPASGPLILAAIECGFPFNPDINGERQDGVPHLPLSISQDRRESGATAYLRSAGRLGHVEARHRSEGAAAAVRWRPLYRRRYPDVHGTVQKSPRGTPARPR